MPAKQKAKAETMVMTVRAPSPLIKQLDKAAAQARRSRSAELLVRLEQSFAAQPVLATTGAR